MADIMDAIAEAGAQTAQMIKDYVGEELETQLTQHNQTIDHKIETQNVLVNKKVQEVTAEGKASEERIRDMLSKAATFVPLVPDENGQFTLKAGNTYRIKKKDFKTLGFSAVCTLIHSYTGVFDNEPVLCEIAEEDLPAPEETESWYVTIRLGGWTIGDTFSPGTSMARYGISVRIYWDGVEKELDNIWDVPASMLENNKVAIHDEKTTLTIIGAEEVLAYNEDSTLTVEGAPGKDGTDGVDGKDGKSIFIRFSDYANGSGMTEKWLPGQRYMGVAVANEAPTDRTKYKWILINGVEITQELGSDKGIAMSQDAVTKAVQAVQDGFDAEMLHARKRITNLEKGLPDDCFMTDSSVAYEKTVPANACPYAAVEEVGGMSYVSKNIFNAKAYANENIAVSNNGALIEVAADPTGSYNTTGFVFAPGKYYVSYGGTGSLMIAVGAAVMNDIPSGGFFTVTEDMEYRNLCFGNEGGTFTNLIIARGESAVAFTPYVGGEGLVHTPVTKVGSLEIPQAVQELPAYGCGINTSIFLLPGPTPVGLNYNWIDWKNKIYHRNVGVYAMTGADNYLYNVLSSAQNIPSDGVAYCTDELQKTDATQGGGPVLCSDFKDLGWDWGKSPELNTMYMGSGNGFLRFCLSKEQFPTPKDFRDYVKERYENGNPIVLHYRLKEEVLIDISDILPDDNFTEVTPGGTVVAESASGNAVPTSITYQLKEN